jgi:hypothetical protein
MKGLLGILKKRWKDALYIGASLFLIGILLLNADVTDTIDRMRMIDLSTLLLVFALYFMNTGIKVLRWHTLIKGMGVKKAGWITLPIFLSSLALNNSTPGKVGGEPVRALMLKEHTRSSITRGIASIFAEKSLDILMILTLSVVGLVYMVIEVGFEDVQNIFIPIAIGGVLLVTMIGFLFSRRASKLMSDVIGRIARMRDGKLGGNILIKIASKVQGSIGKFQRSLSNLRKRKATSAGAVLLTLAIWINEALRLFLIVREIPGGEDVTFMGALTAASLANILGFIIPLGAGNIAGAGAILYILTGEEKLSIPASFTAVATSIWISIPLGLISLMYLRKRSRDRERSKVAEE